MAYRLFPLLALLLACLGGCAAELPNPIPPSYPIGFLGSDQYRVASCVRVRDRIVAPLHLFVDPLGWKGFPDQPIFFKGFAANRAVEAAHGEPKPLNPFNPSEMCSGDWAAIQLAGRFALPPDPDPPFWEIAEEMPRRGTEAWVWRRRLTDNKEIWESRVVTFFDAILRGDGAPGTMRFKFGASGRTGPGWSGSIVLLPPDSPTRPWRWLGLVTGSGSGPGVNYLFVCRPPRAVMEWLRTGDRSNVQFSPVQSNFIRSPDTPG